MTPSARRRFLWELLAMGAVSMFALALLVRVVGERASRSILDRLQDGSRSAGQVLAVHLDGLAGDLNQTAAVVAAFPGTRARVEATLGQLLQRHPRLVRSVALLDGRGAVVSGAMTEGWTAAQGHEMVTRLNQNEALFWAPLSSTGADGDVLAAGVALPADRIGQDDRPHLLAAVVELAEMARLVGNASPPIQRQATLLLAADCTVLAAGSGDPGTGLRGSLRDLLPGADQEGFRDLVCGGVTLRQPIRGWLENGPVQVLVGSSRVEVAGERWTVVSIIPHHQALRNASGVFAAAIAAVVGITIAAGVLLGLRRRAEVSTSATGHGGSRRPSIDPVRDPGWRILVEHSRDPAVHLKGLRIVGANPAALQNLGLDSPATAIDREFLTFVAREERDRVERFLRGLPGGEQVPGTFQTKLVTTTGERRVVDMHVDLVDAEGSFLEHVSWRDVTGSERAESLLRTVALSVPSALLLLDGTGNVVWTNEAFSQTSGFRVEHFQDGSVLPLVVEEDRRRAIVMFGRARHGKLQEGLLRVRLRDGNVDMGAVRLAPVLVGGALFGVVVVGQRFVGSDFLRRGADQEASAATHDLLLNSLSHQLNNDLQSLFATVAGLSTSGALTSVDADRLEQLLGLAAAKARRLLLATRSGAGVMAPVRLGRMVEKWANEARKSVPPEVRLLVKLGTDGERVLADEAQLCLFLDIALETALAVLHPGGGVVEVGVDPAPDRPAVRLAVTDTGAVTDHGTVPGEGSSLMPARRTGRAVAELVAHRHGGVAGCKERAGIGFRLWLDLAVWTGSGLPELPLQVPRGGGAILVADDEETIRRTLADVLREQGRHVVEAANGAEAVELVLANPDRFSLVVLDLVMPVMDGRAALRRLRENLPDIPVLICTGFDPAGDSELLSAEVLIKPFSIQDFLDRVAAIAPAQTGAGSDSGGTMGP